MEQFKKQSRLPKFAVPKRYDLKLKPDLVACKFTGTVEVEIDIKSKKFLVLNAIDLVFNHGSINFKNQTSSKEFRPSVVEMVEEDEIVVLQFDEVLPRKEGTLTIGFEGTLMIE